MSDRPRRPYESGPRRKRGQEIARQRVWPKGYRHPFAVIVTNKARGGLRLLWYSAHTLRGALVDMNFSRRSFLGFAVCGLLSGSIQSVAASAKSPTKTGIDVDRLSVAVGGAGNPAVFVHGFGANKWTWRYLSRGMQDNFTYYLIDLPGSGMSPAPKRFNYTIENFADVIAAFIVRKNLHNVTLIGKSLGGGIVLLTMIRHSDDLRTRIKRICIIDGIAYPQQFPFFISFLRNPVLGPVLVEGLLPEVQARLVLDYCYFDPTLITDKQVQIYAQPLRRREVRDALQKTARLIDTQRLSKYIPMYKTIDVPSLLIWGRYDRVVPLEIGTRLTRELPQARMVVVDRCGTPPMRNAHSK